MKTAIVAVLLLGCCWSQAAYAVDQRRNGALEDIKQFQKDKPSQPEGGPKARVRVCAAGGACQTYVLYAHMHLITTGETVATVRKYFRTVAECNDARAEQMGNMTGPKHRWDEPNGTCGNGGYVTDAEWAHIKAVEEANGQYWPPGTRAPF
jgi:hypothetical protein